MKAQEAPSRARGEWVRIAVIGVLAMIIVVLVVVLLRSRSGEKQMVEVVRQEVEDACQTDDCATALVARRAKEQGSSALCNTIEGDGVIECIKQYAYDKLDPSACDRLKGQVRDECMSHAQYALALQRQEVELCAPIPDEQLQGNCVQSLIKRYIVRNACHETGEFKTICQDMLDARISIAKQIGPDLCEPFLSRDPELGEDGEEYGLCIYALDNVDLDGDGLTIRQEIELGTDNQNRDTDGDGFDDGTEVRSGYNPLGS